MSLLRPVRPRRGQEPTSRPAKAPRASLLVLTLLLLPAWAAAGAPGKPQPLPADFSAPDRFAGSEKIESPPATDVLKDARWCRLCHADEVFEPSRWRSLAHDEQVCADCHTGYHFNPHLPVDLGPEAADTNEGATPAKRRAAAWAACASCHEDDLPEDGTVSHGDGKDEAGQPLESPTCRDCHGGPHDVALAESLPPAERRHRANERCNGCHADEARMAKAGLNTEAASGYAHSVHGRKLDLGGTRAPGCVDCHGGHEHKDLQGESGAKVCGDCHDAATADFVTLGDHRPFTREARPVSYFTLKFFGWLTFLTIFALSVHVVLDVLRSVKVVLARRSGGGQS